MCCSAGTSGAIPAAAPGRSVFWSLLKLTSYLSLRPLEPEGESSRPPQAETCSPPAFDHSPNEPSSRSKATAELPAPAPPRSRALRRNLSPASQGEGGRDHDIRLSSSGSLWASDLCYVRFRHGEEAWRTRLDTPPP